MAKIKMLQLPKKPKAGASITVKEKWLAKIEAIKKENAHRNDLNNYAKRLDAKISGISSAHVLPNRVSVAIIRKNKPTKKRAASKGAKRKTARRKKR